MRKIKLEVYDPPMCCSSGVCGPNINPVLTRFSSILEWLKTQNVDVVRYNLSSNPAAFAGQESVKNALEEEGNECLPLVLVNGYIVSRGTYPSREGLMTFLDISANETCTPFRAKISDTIAPCCKGGGSCC